MAKTEFTFDPSEVIKMFDNLDERERKKVFRSTLKKAAGILVRESKKKLREKIGEAADHPNSWNGKKLSAGIQSKVAKNNRMIKVSIMSDFRLRFFEKGTKERYTKGTHRFWKRKYWKGSNGGAYRGRIQPTYFFRSAKSASEEKVFSSITTNLAKTIKRINDKKYG